MNHQQILDQQKIPLRDVFLEHVLPLFDPCENPFLTKHFDPQQTRLCVIASSVDECYSVDIQLSFDKQWKLIAKAEGDYYCVFHESTKLFEWSETNDLFEEIDELINWYMSGSKPYFELFVSYECRNQSKLFSIDRSGRFGPILVFIVELFIHGKFMDLSFDE
jgi:hypothetical protein